MWLVSAGYVDRGFCGEEGCVDLTPAYPFVFDLDDSRRTTFGTCSLLELVATLLQRHGAAAVEALMAFVAVPLAFTHFVQCHVWKEEPQSRDDRRVAGKTRASAAAASSQRRGAESDGDGNSSQESCLSCSQERPSWRRRRERLAARETGREGACEEGRRFPRTAIPCCCQTPRLASPPAALSSRGCVLEVPPPFPPSLRRLLPQLPHRGPQDEATTDGDAEPAHRRCRSAFGFSRHEIARRSYTVYDFLISCLGEYVFAFPVNDSPLACMRLVSLHGAVFRPRPVSPGAGAGVVHPSASVEGSAIFEALLRNFAGVAVNALLQGLHPATCSSASNPYHINKLLELFIFARGGSIDPLPPHVVLGTEYVQAAAAAFNKMRQVQHAQGGNRPTQGLKREEMGASSQLPQQQSPRGTTPSSSSSPSPSPSPSAGAAGRSCSRSELRLESASAGEEEVEVVFSPQTTNASLDTLPSGEGTVEASSLGDLETRETEGLSPEGGLPESPSQLPVFAAASGSVRCVSLTRVLQHLLMTLCFPSSQELLLRIIGSSSACSSPVSNAALQCLLVGCRWKNLLAFFFHPAAMERRVEALLTPPSRGHERRRPPGASLTKNVQSKQERENRRGNGRRRSSRRPSSLPPCLLSRTGSRGAALGTAERRLVCGADALAGQSRALSDDSLRLAGIVALRSRAARLQALSLQTVTPLQLKRKTCDGGRWALVGRQSAERSAPPSEGGLAGGEQNSVDSLAAGRSRKKAARSAKGPSFQVRGHAADGGSFRDCRDCSSSAASPSFAPSSGVRVLHSEATTAEDGRRQCGTFPSEGERRRREGTQPQQLLRSVCAAASEDLPKRHVEGLLLGTDFSDAAASESATQCIPGAEGAEGERGGFRDASDRREDSAEQTPIPSGKELLAGTPQRNSQSLLPSEASDTSAGDASPPPEEREKSEGTFHSRPLVGGASSLRRRQSAFQRARGRLPFLFLSDTEAPPPSPAAAGPASCARRYGEEKCECGRCRGAGVGEASFFPFHFYTWVLFMERRLRSGICTCCQGGPRGGRPPSESSFAFTSPAGEAVFQQEFQQQPRGGGVSCCCCQGKGEGDAAAAASVLSLAKEEGLASASARARGKAEASIASSCENCTWKEEFAGVVECSSASQNARLGFASREGGWRVWCGGASAQGRGEEEDKKLENKKLENKKLRGEPAATCRLSQSALKAACAEWGVLSPVHFLSLEDVGPLLHRILDAAYKHPGCRPPGCTGVNAPRPGVSEDEFQVRRGLPQKPRARPWACALKGTFVAVFLLLRLCRPGCNRDSPKA